MLEQHGGEDGPPLEKMESEIVELGMSWDLPSPMHSFCRSWVLEKSSVLHAESHNR